MKRCLCLFLLVVTGIALFFFLHDTQRYAFVNNEGEYDIVVKDTIIGGIKRYNRDPQEEYIGNIIIDAGIFDFDTTKVDFYMIESSLYGDWLLSYGTIEKEIHHELFLYESYLYSVWFNLSEISSEEKTAIMELFMEEIYPHLDQQQP